MQQRPALKAGLIFLEKKGVKTILKCGYTFIVEVKL